MAKSRESILENYKEKCGAFEVSHDVSIDDVLTTYIHTERFVAETLYTSEKDFDNFPEDIKNLYRVTFADSFVMQRSYTGKTKTPYEFADIVTRQSLRALNHDPFSAFIVTNKLNDEVVGFEGITNRVSANQIEIFYLFRQDYQRHKGIYKNVGYENAGALIWGHGEGLSKQVIANQEFIGGEAFTGVYATTRTDNWGSIKILESLGFTQQRITQKFEAPRYEYVLDYRQYLPEMGREQVVDPLSAEDVSHIGGAAELPE